MFGILDAITDLTKNTLDLALTPLEIGARLINVPVKAAADITKEINKSIKDELK